MERKRLFSVVARLVIAVVIIVAMAAFGLSRTSEPQKPAPRPDYDSAKEAIRDRMVKAQTDGPTTGWLFID